MFLVFRNDIKDIIGNESYMNVFAGDTKIRRIIVTENSYLELQNNPVKLQEWTHRKQMKCNGEKCHLIWFGKRGMRLNHNINSETISK